MGNVTRTDCRSLTVETGVKYAQYNNAVRVTWLAKGKRKARATVLTYNPFLIVVETRRATGDVAEVIGTVRVKRLRKRTETYIVCRGVDIGSCSVSESSDVNHYAAAMFAGRRRLSEYARQIGAA